MRSHLSRPRSCSVHSPWRIIVGVSAALGFSSCARLEPFEDVISRLPADEFLQINGQSVHLRQWGQGGRPLLLLHGFGASAYSFRELGPRLGKSRHVVAIDLNGFGYTERPEDAEAYSFKGQLNLVRSVMDELGIRRADVVGHSYSGYLAARLAEKDPLRVRRLVLISPALEQDVAPPAIARSRTLRGALYPLLRGVLSSPRLTRSVFESAYYQLEDFPLEVSEEYRKRLLVEGLDRAYQGFGAQLEEFTRDTTSPGDLDQPVLVIAAREDRIVPLESIESQLTGSDVPLVVIENSGHSSPEEQPEELSQQILDFIGE